MEKSEAVVGEVVPSGLMTGVDASVDMSSVADILVVAKEQQLEEEEEGLRNESNALAKKISEQGKAVDKAVEAQSRTVLKNQQLTAVVALLKQLGVTFIAEVVGATISAGKVVVSRQLQKKGSRYSGDSVSLPDVTLAPSAAVKKATIALDKTQKAKSKVDKRLYEVIKRLKHIDKEQRRAKAAVALTNLQATPEGQDFLKKLAMNTKNLPKALTA